MSTYFVFSYGILIASLLLISCSTKHQLSYAFPYQLSDKPNFDPYSSNEDSQIPLMIYPKYSASHLFQRSPKYYPRTSRNSWFRVSTYQRMKPTLESEEKAAGDNLMRWG